MNPDKFYKMYNSKMFSIVLISLFIFSIYTLNLNGSSVKNAQTNTQIQFVSAQDTLPTNQGRILNAKDQNTQIYDGITPEIPPNPEDIKVLTEDKIINSLNNITFKDNSIEDLMSNIEKIYIQEITEELKSIEL